MSGNIPTWYHNHNRDIHPYTVVRKNDGCEKRTYIYWIFFQCATWVCNSECSRSRDFYILVSAWYLKRFYISWCQHRVSFVWLIWEGESSSTWWRHDQSGSWKEPRHTISHNYVYHIATHLSTTIRWQVWDCQSKQHFGDQPTLSTSKPDQDIADSAIFGGCQRCQPLSYPTLSNCKSSIVILTVRRGWYHTRVSSVVKKNGKVRLHIYWYFYRCIRLII